MTSPPDTPASAPPMVPSAYARAEQMSEDLVFSRRLTVSAAAALQQRAYRDGQNSILAAQSTNAELVAAVNELLAIPDWSWMHRWGRCDWQTIDASLTRLRKALAAQPPAPHPYYGPCDSLAPDGDCAECLKGAAPPPQPAPEQPGEAERLSRWTTEEIDALKAELNSRYLLDPIYRKCSDALGSLQFDLVDREKELDAAQSALASKEAELQRAETSRAGWIKLYQEYDKRHHEIVASKEAEVARLTKDRDDWRRRAATAVATTGRVQEKHAAELARLRPPTATGEDRTLLQRAERLWQELQDNELGGFSGINRPFWIVQAFKEVNAAARAQGEREGIEKCAQWIETHPDCLRNVKTSTEVAKELRALAIPEPQE